MPICLVNLRQGWHRWHSHRAWEEALQKYGLQLRHCGSRASSTRCASRTVQRCNLPVGEEWRSWRELPGTDLLKALQTYRYRTKSASTDFSFGMFWVESHWDCSDCFWSLREAPQSSPVEEDYPKAHGCLMLFGVSWLGKQTIQIPNLKKSIKHAVIDIIWYIWYPSISDSFPFVSCEKHCCAKFKTVVICSHRWHVWQVDFSPEDEDVLDTQMIWTLKA